MKGKIQKPSHLWLHLKYHSPHNDDAINTPDTMASLTVFLWPLSRDKSWQALQHTEGTHSNMDLYYICLKLYLRDKATNDVMTAP